MSLNVTSGDVVILGGTSASGYEETPTLRYEATDKSGARVVTAVLSRRIVCLAKYAETIKQSAAFPGQIVEVNGVGYGAGWEVSGVNVVPTGGGFVAIQIEARREGITPFEWELPPKLSVECEDGIAKLYYTKEGGTKVEMLRFDSQTGEDRYGWRVEYKRVGTKNYAVLHVGWNAVDLFDVTIFYENRAQFSLPFDGSRFEIPNRYENGTKTVTVWNGTQEAAIAAAVAKVEAEAATNRATPPMDAYGTARYVIQVNGDAATATQRTNDDWFGAYHWEVSVPVVWAEFDVETLIEAQNRGVHWESVTDTDSGSATYQHVFYRLVYANTIILAIDITAAESA